MIDVQRSDSPCALRSMFSCFRWCLLVVSRSYDAFLIAYFPHVLNFVNHTNRSIGGSVYLLFFDCKSRFWHSKCMIWFEGRTESTGYCWCINNKTLKTSPNFSRKDLRSKTSLGFLWIFQPQKRCQFVNLPAAKPRNRKPNTLRCWTRRASRHLG